MMKVRDLTKMLEKNGWRIVRQKGSLRQYRHPLNPNVLTVAGNPGDSIGVRYLERYF